MPSESTSLGPAARLPTDTVRRLPLPASRSRRRVSTRSPSGFPRIYFSGLAQHMHSEWLTGQHVLEAFSNTRPLMAPYRALFRSMALEPGVIANLNAKKKGRPDVVHFEPYLEFAQQHGAFYDWVVSFDVIDGGPEENQRYWSRLLDARIPNLMPVFHQGEPWSLLEEYCEHSSWLGLGFQRPRQNQEEWLDECFSRIPRRMRVHGFAMTAFIDYPFSSVDSTTWIHDLLDMLTASGQAGSVLRCLTRSELADLVLRKYQRLPLMQLWRGSETEEAPLDAARELADMLADLEKYTSHRLPARRREHVLSRPPYHLSADCYTG